MRIGLVCEGPTDVLAVENFIGDQIRRMGLQPAFRNLFPETDKTRPEGGWSNLLLWLQRNPAESRVARYFTVGLFGGVAAQEALDVIIIQIDADVVSDPGLRAFAQDKLNLQFGECNQPSERANAMTEIVRRSGDFASLTNVDAERHIVLVAVEATEAWCVAAFRGQPGEFESLRGADLTNAFMHALEVSEGRQPQVAYVSCDKDVQRRRRFCSMFANQSDRIVQSCPQFANAVNALSVVSGRP